MAAILLPPDSWQIAIYQSDTLQMKKTGSGICRSGIHISFRNKGECPVGFEPCLAWFCKRLFYQASSFISL
jgi:hypothetical protein